MAKRTIGLNIRDSDIDKFSMQISHVIARDLASMLLLLFWD